MSTGLLLLRIVVGALLIGHGTQKLFGWFGGHGLTGVGGWFHSLGFRPGKLMAVVAGLGETVGGALLLLGLLTPLAAAIIVGTLVVAASTHLPKVWNTDGGLELPLTMATVGAMYGFTGPGRYSLDHALGLNTSGLEWGLLAAGLGLVGALGVVALARHNLTSDRYLPEAYPAEPARTEVSVGAHRRR
jgi:putative oxidoreductase